MQMINALVKTHAHTNYLMHTFILINVFSSRADTQPSNLNRGVPERGWAHNRSSLSLLRCMRMQARGLWCI